MKIKLLDNSTIQKIAAGEVIEKPASIVKELVENSIDANSKNITVNIDNGGIDNIIVSDDGIGIEEEDISLAFMRHATSKIEFFEDLYQIYSMGFRGEALASIIAAATVEIKTKTEDNNTGTKVLFESGKEISRNKIAMNTGTIIRVSDLFKNIPVRKKFLKSKITEGNSITELMQKLALGNPDISFKYIKDSKIQFQTILDDDYISNVGKLFGKNLADSLIYIDGKTENYSYYGYITDNRYYRGNRSLQYIYVNKRYIEAKEIALRLERIYRQVIPNGKFPAFQIFIKTNPENIDVNIHPNKQSIKFRFLDELLDSLSDKVKYALLPRNLKNISGLIEDKKEDLEFYIKNDINTVKEDKYENLLNKYTENNEVIEFNFQKPTDYEDNISSDEDSIEEDFIIFEDSDTFDQENGNASDNFSQRNSEIYDISIDDNYDENLDINKEQNLNDKKENKELFLNYKYIGVVLKTFLIFEDIENEQMILMDQHAAHERIMYEKINNILNFNDIPTQPLISPIIIEMISSDIELYNNNKEIFNNFGFHSDLIGNNAVAIREVPSFLDNIDFKRLFLDIVDVLDIDKNVESDYISEMIMMKACKSAVKSGDILSEYEVKKLLDDLKRCENPLTCPHGRPTFIIFDKNKLEKEFLRIK